MFDAVYLEPDFQGTAGYASVLRSGRAPCSSFAVPTDSGPSELHFAMTIAFGARRRVGPLPSGPSMWGTCSGSRSCQWAFGNAGNAKSVVRLLTLIRKFAGYSNGQVWFFRLPFRCLCGPAPAMRILECSVGSFDWPPRQEAFCFSLICLVLRKSHLCARNWR